VKKYFIKRKNKSYFKDVEPHEVLLDALSKKNEEKWGFPKKRIETPLLEKVFKGFSIFSFLLIFSLFVRTFQLQIIQGQEFLEQSSSNKYISYKIQSERGVVYDKDLKQLIFNIPNFDLICNKEKLPSLEEERSIILEKLSSILGQDKEALSSQIEESNKLSFVISENLDHKELIILEVKIKELTGFEIKQSLFRDYNDGATYAHLIGYTGRIDQEQLDENPGFYSPLDNVGKTGLEEYYEEYLRKIPGKLRVETDVLGNVFSEEIVSLPESGNSLVLYLDSDLQKKIKESLEQQLELMGGSKAVAVAIDPKTGGILSLVSLPSFDNNTFATSNSEQINNIFKDEDEPLFNRTLSGIGYPTGSAIKPLIAAAALQENIISPDRFINCQGLIEVEHEYDPDIVYQNHDWEIHSYTDMRKAIAESCNVYFYSIGGGNKDFGIKGLGGSAIKEYLELFGWGEKTGIDLPSEGNSILPTIDYNWRLGNTYHFSIGQGPFSILPIQVTSAYTAIANGGILLKPQVVQKIVSYSSSSFDVIKEFHPEIIREGFIDSDNLQIVREGMRQAVTGQNSPLASATILNTLPVTSAAKTGTAETPEEGVYHNWVTVFAPYEDPEIVLTVMFESVSGLRSASVPAAREILNWYFTK